MPNDCVKDWGYQAAVGHSAIHNSCRWNELMNEGIEDAAEIRAHRESYKNTETESSPSKIS